MDDTAKVQALGGGATLLVTGMFGAGKSTVTRLVAEVSATNVSGAVMGRAGFGTLTLREDDGVSDGAASAPAVGLQGDVCAGSR